MTIIDDNKIYDEVERFYRNNDILTTIQRKVEPTDNFETFSGVTSYLIDKTNVKNIRRIEKYVASTTWELHNTSNRHIFNSSMNENGRYQLFGSIWNDAGTHTYLSTDYGETWKAISNNDETGTTGPSAMSANGQYMAFTTEEDFYCSNDFGKTWRKKTIIHYNRGIAISGTGQYQTITAYLGKIYVSTDYGETWDAKESDRGWWDVSVSYSGQYQSATVLNGKIYVSSDYGETWTPKESDRNWQDISVSRTGQYQYATDHDISGGSQHPGHLYKSDDYGNTWTTIGPLQEWLNIKCAQDGKYVVACCQDYDSQPGSYNAVYTSSDYGATWEITTISDYCDCKSIALSYNAHYCTIYGDNYYSTNKSREILEFGTDYTYITDYNDSGTYKTQINFTNSLTGYYTIYYDYGSDKIFADWPRSDLTLKSFPRVAITFGAKQTEDIAIGGTAKRTYIPFTVTVVKDNNREINDILKIVREVSLLNQKDFYYIDYITTTGDTPVLPYSESVQELQQKGLEFKALLPLEEIPF